MSAGSMTERMWNREDEDERDEQGSPIKGNDWDTDDDLDWDDEDDWEDDDDTDLE